MLLQKVRIVSLKKFSEINAIAMPFLSFAGCSVKTRGVFQYFRKVIGNVNSEKESLQQNFYSFTLFMSLQNSALKVRKNK